MDACAGIDQGDGYDCYGHPVFGGVAIGERYSDAQKRDIAARLASGAFLTLAEQVAIRNGLLGADGVALLAARTGGAQPLPTVNVQGVAPGVLVLVVLLLLLARGR